MSKRLNPKARKAQILTAAIQVAERKGYMNIQRADVAEQAGVSPALVSHIFTTMPKLRRAVMRYAVRTENCKVVLQGLAVNDSQALKAPHMLRVAAANFGLK